MGSTKVNKVYGHCIDSLTHHNSRIFHCKIYKQICGYIKMQHSIIYTMLLCTCNNVFHVLISNEHGHQCSNNIKYFDCYLIRKCLKTFCHSVNLNNINGTYIISLHSIYDVRYQVHIIFIIMKNKGIKTRRNQTIKEYMYGQLLTMMFEMFSMFNLLMNFKKLFHSYFCRQRLSSRALNQP